jgi:hypothetical protein
MRRVSMGVFMLALVFSPLLVLVCAALGYEAGIAELSKSIVADAAKFQKQKLAVVDFTDLAGNVTELGRFLAEELSVSLVLAGAGLEMVDRTQLNKIFQEQALSFSGAIDPAAVKKVGQIAGVDALIAGTITDLGDTVRLTLKIMATDTGRLISAARTNIPKTGTISMLKEREVAVQSLPTPARPGVESETRVQSVGPQKGRIVDLGSLQVTLESLRPLGKQSLIAYMAFTNKTDKELLVIPAGSDKVIASDDLGNHYDLKNSTGMQMNCGACVMPSWGTFLKIPPKLPTRASFTLSTRGEMKQGSRINLSAEYRVVTDFDNKKYFTTTATFLDLKPD